MRILAIDVGTGTQDILLFDSSVAIENCFKMVAPSPTVVIANRIRNATAGGHDIFLSGVTMGGGPCRWAAEDHLRAGLHLFATADAARTFDDDLEVVRGMGVQIVGDDLPPPDDPDVVHIPLKDVDLSALCAVFAALDVSYHYDGIAVAVQDHGAAPPGVSDRLFRFEYLQRTIAARNSLLSFAYLADEVPPFLTRMRAVVDTVGDAQPLLLVDTGPAAALGALEDPEVADHVDRILVNIGNLHTLAFRLVEDQVLGFFEHHTGLLTPEKLNYLVNRLNSGQLTHEEVFSDHGHGAFVLGTTKPSGFLTVTGPRRAMMSGSPLKPYFAVPCGDMMLAGCFGLVRAFGEKIPEWREEIACALGTTCDEVNSAPDIPPH